MAIETCIVDNTLCVDVPKGTRPYSDKALKRNREYLKDVYISGLNPEGLNIMAARYQRSLDSVEKAFYRVVHTMTVSDPVEVLSALHI